MARKYKEPDYLVLSKEEKRSINKTLLIVPILCLCFLCIMFAGERDVTSPLPSFSECNYFFKANRIADEFCDGNFSNVMAHNLSFFDNGTINYVYYSGINEIYQGGEALLQEVYDTFLKDKFAISFMGMPRMQLQTHLNKFCEEDNRNYIWRSLGYIYVNGKDVIQLDIQFISPEVYYVFITPTTPSTDEEELTEQELFDAQLYLQSESYALLQKTGQYMEWVFNVGSAQSNDTLKYLENIFTKVNLSPSFLQQFITRYFTARGWYLGEEFTEELEANYQSNFAWMLYGMARDVNVERATVSYGMYDSVLNGILLDINIALKDAYQKNAHISIPVVYTPAGYQVIPTGVTVIQDEEFTSARVLELARFLQYDIMPEDLLIEKAAASMKKNP